jgi:hypothetical protein
MHPAQTPFRGQRLPRRGGRASHLDQSVSSPTRARLNSASCREERSTDHSVAARSRRPSPPRARGDARPSRSSSRSHAGPVQASRTPALVRRRGALMIAPESQHRVYHASEVCPRIRKSGRPALPTAVRIPNRSVCTDLLTPEQTVCAIAHPSLHAIPLFRAPSISDSIETPHHPKVRYLTLATRPSVDGSPLSHGMCLGALECHQKETRSNKRPS